MIKKILILTGAYFVLIFFVQSCDHGYCKDVDYYDFSEIQVHIKSLTTVETSDSLNFEIRQLDTRYMAWNRIRTNLIKTTCALNCDYGRKGMKIPMTKIEITSNSNFNEAYPANSLLNDLIIVKILEEPNKIHSKYHFEKLDSVEFEKLLPKEDFLNPDLYIAEHPTIDMTHRLIVKIFKSNGDTIIAESEQIFWK